MRHLITSHLIGFGHYAPAQRIDNAQLEAWFNLEAGWIERRTGIRTRHWVEEGETLIDLAEKASAAALKMAATPKYDIGLTILATSTPDRLLPPTAPLLAHRLGLTHSGAFDLSGACSGFLYALVMADGYVRSSGKSALVVAANILSRRINRTEHESAILFADAAGATVLIPSTDRTKGLLGVSLASDGSGYELMTIAAGGSQLPFSSDIPSNDYKMKLRDGQALFTQAVHMMATCASRAMMDAKLTAADIDRFVPHQANARLMLSVAKRLNMAPEKMLSIVENYGNSSAAGIPLSLSLCQQQNPYMSGEKLLLTTAGAGLTGGAIVLGL